MTDAEKTAFEKLTDAEKKTFMDAKRTAEQTKRDAQDTVIDKLLNGESLTDADKAIVVTIKAERADRKAKMTEMKAKMDAVKVIIDKKEAGTTLTTDEQTTLDSMPKRGMGGPQGGQGGQRGERPTQTNTDATVTQ